jgi:alkanesulfonate monooxygenase
MPVEFLGIAGTNAASEVTPRSGGSLDLDYTRRLARAHEDHGWDRILFAYHSGSPDPAAVAAYVAGHTERINLVLAHRPNVSAPTYAAKTFATLDHISGGRFEVHFITGGSTADQAAEGDYLDKDTRYERTREYIQIVKQAWTSAEPFDYDGNHYQIKNFRSDIRPLQQPRPRVSFGGSSSAAYAVGAAESDIYALWGEPLAGTREQIASIEAAATAVGREQRPTLQIAFRPIIAPTEELAWAKAEKILGRINALRHGGAVNPLRRSGSPENAGSQRLLAAACGADRHDRALWTAPTAVTGGGGNSTALVGTPETVAAALLDYYDLGINLLSARGYDIYDDAIDFGRYVIPLVREEVARRDAAAAAAHRAAEVENNQKDAINGSPLAYSTS